MFYPDSIIILTLIFILSPSFCNVIRHQRDYPEYRYLRLNAPMLYQNNPNKFQRINFVGRQQNLQLLQPKKKRPDIIFPDDDSADAQYQQGSLCSMGSDGRSGYCLPAFQCLHALRDRQELGIQVKTCSYDGKMPIICCPLQGFAQQGINNGVTAQQHENRISAKKCAEFSKYSEDIIKIIPLSFDATVHEYGVKNCDSSIPLVVGGKNAEYGEYPHMALVGWRHVNNNKQDPVNWQCGGSLISEDFVLTAAHCTLFHGKPPDVVRLGEHNLYSQAARQWVQDIEIADIFRHPNYKSNSFYDDIALIRLKRRPLFSKTLRPACLWQNSVLNATQVVATGWGHTQYAGQKARILKKVRLDIIDPPVCQRLYQDERKLRNGIVDTQLCAGLLSGGRDTCQGDSGGPIQVYLKDSKCSHFIVGITSFGKFCAAANAPGVYTKVYPYLDWIERIVFTH